MSTSIAEGNKIINEFDGGKNYSDKYEELGISCNKRFLELGHYSHCMPTKDLQYHTSWDWQVPAWSKIAKLLKDIADNGGNGEYAIYMGIIGRYENAVFNNVPMEGFVVIADAIFWYNFLTPKQQ